MAVYPPAIIVVNNDLTDSVESMLITQLQIDNIVDGYYYDHNISALNTLKNSGKRILVIRSLFDTFDRTSVDLVLFIKAGLISVLTNKFGPPNATFSIVNLSWKYLGVSGDNHSLL